MPISQQQVTKDELLALTDATIKTAKVLEEIHFQLEKLNKLDTLDEHIKYKIADEISEKIGKMGLDLGDEKSAIASRFAEMNTIIKSQAEVSNQLRESFRRAVWAVLFLVAVFGGYRPIADYFHDKKTPKIEYFIDKSGQIYIIDPSTKEEFFLVPKK